MAQPVRTSAAERDNLRQMMTGAAELCTAAVAHLAASPGDCAALHVAQLAVTVLADAAEVARRHEVDDALIEAMCARAVEQDRASRRPRGRLRRVVLPGR